MVETCLLADAPEAIPQIAAWYKVEWAEWFANTPMSEIENDLRNVAHRGSLPFAMAAIDAKRHVVGACSVRAEPFEPYPHASPWLRGLLVPPASRRQGIALALVLAAQVAAGKMGVPEMLAATSTANSVFERANWQQIDSVVHHGAPLVIFRWRESE